MEDHEHENHSLEHGAMPDAPPGKISNVYAWLLALFPFLTASILPVFSRRLSEFQSASEIYGLAFLLTLIGTGLLGWLDEEEVIAKGMVAPDTEYTSLFWWFPLPYAPFYLYRRARRIGSGIFFCVISVISWVIFLASVPS